MEKPHLPIPYDILGEHSVRLHHNGFGKKSDDRSLQIPHFENDRANLTKIKVTRVLPNSNHIDHLAVERVHLQLVGALEGLRVHLKQFFMFASEL